MPAKAYVERWIVMVDTFIADKRTGQWTVDLGGKTVMFQLNLHNAGDEAGMLFGEISEVMPRREYGLSPCGTVGFPVTFTFPTKTVIFTAIAGHNGIEDDRLWLTWNAETKLLVISETPPPVPPVEWLPSIVLGVLPLCFVSGTVVYNEVVKKHVG